MVQVDVFWSYGIGAGLGLASAAKGLRTLERPLEALRSADAFQALLFLAVVFAPSGFVLLWSFPSWETMHVGTRELPGWLVALFGITNITQGLLGFVVARWLSSRGRAFSALLHWLGGYFGMFFILVHGWDGSGYQRFFSPTREALTGWTWRTAASWLTSDVALTLLAMGVVLIPWLVGLTVSWLRASQRAPAAAALWVAILLLLVVGVPAFAVASSVLVRQLGAPLGAAATFALALALTHRRVGPLRRLFAWLGFDEERAAPALKQVTA
ncbi:MAG: hypothetical protein IAE78_23940 [Myxococcus sp.]|nr:hypothetical protein [Myxococcus sp.]